MKVTSYIKSKESFDKYVPVFGFCMFEFVFVFIFSIKAEECKYWNDQIKFAWSVCIYNNLNFSFNNWHCQKHFLIYFIFLWLIKNQKNNCCFEQIYLYSYNTPWICFPKCCISILNIFRLRLNVPISFSAYGIITVGTEFYVKVRTKNEPKIPWSLRCLLIHMFVYQAYNVVRVDSPNIKIITERKSSSKLHDYQLIINCQHHFSWYNRLLHILLYSEHLINIKICFHIEQIRSFSALC